jgi:outer membrane lipoprotein SlyB
MKRKTASFTGQRPIFTGSVAIVPGGFNLDVVNQSFPVGAIIPAGSLAVFDEAKRTVQIVKTASVSSVNAEDSKVVTLKVDEFYEPIFAVGDKVAKIGAISGTYAAAAAITAINRTPGSYVITLDKAISDLAEGDGIEQVVADASGNAVEIGKANGVTICDVEVDEFETSVDVTADTIQYALYERRVPVIPATQKDATGNFLNVNPHVKFTQSY